MILQNRKDSILYDESGMPWCVRTPAQLDAVNQALETILACKKTKSLNCYHETRVITLPHFYNYTV